MLKLWNGILFVISKVFLCFKTLSFDVIIGKSCEPEIDSHAGSWFTRNFLCQITKCSFTLKKLSLIFLLHFWSRTGNFFTEHMVHFTGGRHCHVLFVFAQFCAFQRNCSMSEGDFVCFPKEAKKRRDQEEIKKISCWFPLIQFWGTTI